MLEGFDFGTPAIANQLTGTLAALKSYNALNVPADYFMEAMGRLRERFLNVQLDAVLHPASPAVHQATKSQQAAADTAPSVQEEELTAQQWFERGFLTEDLDEQVRFNSQAIRLKPEYAMAFYNRGVARQDKGDLEGALQDYNEAIRLNPNHAEALVNRGNVHADQGDLAGALKDYDEAILINPRDADAFSNRGDVRADKGDMAGALRDYDESIRIKPDYVEVYNNRGLLCEELGDLPGALRNYDESIHINPFYPNPYYNRALVFRRMRNYKAAIADFQKYLDNGGGAGGDQREVERMIRDLTKKVEAKRAKAKTDTKNQPRKKWQPKKK
jgi:tetratricopeptide (TPR) repeat protein